MSTIEEKVPVEEAVAERHEEVLEGFCAQFSALALALKLPKKSVLDPVRARLLKRDVDPSDEDLDEAAVATVKAALEHASTVYQRKRERARQAGAAKAAATRAAKAETDPSEEEPEEPAD
jgi:hypothetical protein